MTDNDEAPLEYPSGPWVNVAVICERPLVDTDGLLSLIRIIDRIRVATDAPELFAEPAPFRVAAQAMVLLSGSSEHNDGVFSLRVISPSGQGLPGHRVPVRFRNQLSTQRITVNLELGLTEPGVYWIDVYFNERVLTRIPLLVEFAHDALGEEQTNDSTPEAVSS